MNSKFNFLHIIAVIFPSLLIAQLANAAEQKFTFQAKSLPNYAQLQNEESTISQGNLTTPSFKGDFFPEKVEMNGKSIYLNIEEPNLSEKKSRATATSNDQLNIGSMNYFMNYIDNQSLYQRMGQIRNPGYEGGDVWFRVYSGYLDGFDDPNMTDKLSFTAGQIGLDGVIASSDVDNVVIGGMVGFTKGDADYLIGQNKATTYSAGIYASYKHQSGLYADASLKYVRIKNKLETATTNDVEINGEGSSSGFNVGIEVGKRFTASGDSVLAQVHWFVEPQLQLNYSRQGDTTISTNQGEVAIDSFDSLIGRIGVLFGYSIFSTEYNIVDIYFKAGYAREFKGATGYSYNDFINTYSYKGGWVDTGFGINFEFSENHSLYFDINYAFGSLFKQRQFNLGYRYNF